MKTRVILPVLAVATLALAGCANSNEASAPASHSESSTTASPSESSPTETAQVESTPSESETATGGFNSDTGNPGTAEQQQAGIDNAETRDKIKKGVENSKANVVVLRAHSDKPATVSYNDREENFVGDWEKTITDGGNNLYHVSVLSDDGSVGPGGEYISDNNMTCSITADGDQLDQDQSNSGPICMQIRKTE